MGRPLTRLRVWWWLGQLEHRGEDRGGEGKDRGVDEEVDGVGCAKYDVGGRLVEWMRHLGRRGVFNGMHADS